MPNMGKTSDKSSAMESIFLFKTNQRKYRENQRMVNSTLWINSDF